MKFKIVNLFVMAIALIVLSLSPSFAQTVHQVAEGTDVLKTAIDAAVILSN